MASATIDAVAATLAREGMSMVKAPMGRFAYDIRCSGCNATDHWSFGTVLAAETVVAKARRNGWETGKRPVCADCRSKAKERKDVGTMELKEAAAKGAAAAVAASDAAKRAKRMVFMALEDYYDDGKRAYKPGWSDERIAKELGLSEATVANIRDENYGPAGEPPEIEKLRAEFAAWEADRRKAIASVRELANAANQNAANIEAHLNASVEAFNARLDRLALANGWRS